MWATFHTNLMLNSIVWPCKSQKVYFKSRRDSKLLFNIEGGGRIQPYSPISLTKCLILQRIAISSTKLIKYFNIDIVKQKAIFNIKIKTKENYNN